MDSKNEYRLFVENENGFQLTELGFRELTPKFNEAGIDINSISSKSDFCRACLEINKNTEFSIFIDDDSGFRFTEFGLKEMRPYFAKGGININQIKSKSEYYAARRACSHLFDDHLLTIASNGPMTLERKGLIAIAKGDYEESDRILAKLHKRNKLNLRVI